MEKSSLTERRMLQKGDGVRRRTVKSSDRKRGREQEERQEMKGEV